MEFLKNGLSVIQGKPVLYDFFQASLVILFTAIAVRIVQILNRWISRHLIKRTQTQFDDEILELISETLRRLFWLSGFYILIQVMDSIFAPGSLQYRYTQGGLYVAAVFMIAHWASSTLQILMDWYSESKAGVQGVVPLRDEFRPLLRRLVMIIVYTISVVSILRHFQQDISSILVSLGIGSLAIALAAKDTMANMIAGFMIMTDRPFRLGDRILLESGEKGDVFDIGLRTTKILTFDNTLIVVPNQQIINEKVTNLSYPDPQIRIVVEVGVAYGCDLDHVKSILIAICNEHPDVLDTPAPEADLLCFGESSLDLRVVCRVSRWGDQWRVSEEIRMEIYRRFNREGIEIPFAQRVVTIRKT
ncbi:mechanosensitive ion channel family protein [bacterium]|nr:mechanosensitive ion channel family protein [bacterium]